MKPIIAALAFLATTIASAAAQQQPATTHLHLTESAEKQVHRDRIVAALAAEAEGSEIRPLQAEINRRMEAALEKARAVSAVKSETGAYSVYEEQKPRRWHASQMLLLSGADPAALLDLVGTLQSDGMVTHGLQFTLSREAQRAAEDELVSDALARMRASAERVAAAMQMSIAGYREITINHGGPVRPLAFQAKSSLASASSVPSPAAEAGDETVTVSVQAEVLLQPGATRP